MSKFCDICTSYMLFYNVCIMCDIIFCTKCGDYGIKINTMCKVQSSCSISCTYNWMNSEKEEQSVHHALEYSIERIDYLAPFKKLQENYIDMHWSNNAAKICNEILIGDVCRVIREYLN